MQTVKNTQTIAQRAGSAKTRNCATPRPKRRIAFGHMLMIGCLVLVGLTAPSAAHSKSVETTAKRVDTQPRLAIATAFAPEFKALLPELEGAEEHRLNGVSFWTGHMRQTPVILFKTGVSLVNAAMNTQRLLDHFEVKAIVVSGIAGGLDPALSIGDVTVPAEWAQFNETVYMRETEPGVYTPYRGGKPALTPFQFMAPRGVRIATNADPSPDRRVWFGADPDLLKLAQSAANGIDLDRCNDKGACLREQPKVVVNGKGVTGSVFMDNAKFRKYLYTTFDAQVVEMETAAIAMVAYANDVPYVAFRSLSDLAGGGKATRNEIEVFGTLAAKNAATVVLAFLDRYQTQSNSVVTDKRTVLARLAEDYNAFELAENPIAAAREGDRDAAGRLPDVSLAAVKRRQTAYEGFLARVSAIKPEGLTAQDRATLGLLRHDITGKLADIENDAIRIPFTNDSGFHTTLDYLARQSRIATVEDANALLSRYRAYPRYLAQHRVHLERGIETGWTQPALVVDRVIQTLRNSQVGPDPKQHSLYKAFASLPSSLSDKNRSDLQREAEAVIRENIAPALRDLLTFMETEYRPAARSKIGISSLKGGADYYAQRVRFFTTLDITPKDVHAIGEREVARIRALMLDIIKEVGFKGSFADFLTFLRTDDQFYATSRQTLLERAAYLSKRADGQMPKYFATLPRLSYGVIPVPRALEEAYTTGRYWRGSPEQGVAGNYVVNTYDLKGRPLYELPALTLHEAVPGHHHQIALAQEIKNLPAFRKRTQVTAYSEGWGLYAEYLGEEMGIYQTPYERFGRYSYEMWRACRLVVDTGIHAFGWNREKAEECFLENSALSRTNITTEVDRYISWPGQAVAYKIGELKIKSLRARAEKALGDKFDIRYFHDAVLEDGFVTLAILEDKIERWIKAQQ